MRGDDERTTERPASAKLDEYGLLASTRPQQMESIVATSPASTPAWMEAMGSLLGGGLKDHPKLEKPTGEQPSYVPPLPEPEPHAVLVFHGSAVGDKPAALEWITFEDADSSKIIAVTKGLPTRASATMRERFDSGYSRRKSLNPDPRRSDNNE